MMLVLASQSRARQTLLKNAGIDFETVPAEVDERAAERPLIEAGAPPDDIALALAMAKAMAVSERRPADLVIGADQVAAIDGERLVKPPTMEDARSQLLKLSGGTHTLHSAVAVARAGTIEWHIVESAHLTMRALTPGFVGRYLAEVGAAAFESVGAYQLEGRGVQLFERIDGDFFAILGLPLLPLLAFLRAEGAIE